MWEKAKSSGNTAYQVLREAGKEYGTDRVNRMAAAVGYRAMFALAPLLLLAIFVFGLVLGSDSSAQNEILDAVADFAGAEVAEAMEVFLTSVEATGDTAGVVGFVLLLWSGSSLFQELQNALNDIFHVPYEYTAGVIAFVKKRGLGFLFALGLGLTVVAVWLLNSVWHFLGGLFPESFEPAHRVIGILTPFLSFVILPFVIALSFQVLSQVRVRWRSIWWGSFFTSVVFLVAAYGTNLYFRYSGSSAAGAAGAIVVILLLAYVLSAVFLYGAEVTKVYDDYLAEGDVRAPRDRESEPVPEVVVAEPNQPVPVAAIVGFLSGLFVGWRRKS